MRLWLKNLNKMNADFVYYPQCRVFISKVAVAEIQSNQQNQCLP
jgi:hypothetical protein